MCAIIKVGQNTVQPGMDMFVYHRKGSEYLRWGFGGLYNARLESLSTGMWKRYGKVIVPVDSFFEGGILFETSTVLDLAGLSDGTNFYIITRNAVSLIKPYHGRMPVIIADKEEFIMNNRINEINYDLLKIA